MRLHQLLNSALPRAIDGVISLYAVTLEFIIDLIDVPLFKIRGQIQIKQSLQQIALVS